MRFVSPVADVLTLANGDTLTVKRRLNMGETRESFAACSTLVKQDDGTYERVPDPLLIGRARAAAYLLAWTSAEGSAPPLEGLDLAGKLAILDNLADEDFYEIRAAVDAHEATQAAARAEEKTPEFAEARRSDLSLAVRLGWRVDWIRELDPDDYAILVELLSTPA